MRRLLFVLIGLAMVLQGCMYAVRYDGTYKGKVIDEETRAPIEGVVVLGVWYKEQWGAAGTVSTYYDARETVTDKKGEFVIRGHGLRVMTNLAPMNVLLFKAGYTYYGMYPWEAFINTFKNEDGKPLVPLKKLTKEERKKQGTPDIYIGARYDKKENRTHSCLPKNIKLLPKEVNKESLEQGLKPYNLEGGRCEK